MFSSKNLLVIFILIPWTLAYGSIEQLRELNNSIKNEYPGFVESRYEYFLNHYYSQRVDETRIMTQTILEKGQKALEELNSAQNDLTQRGSTITSADVLHVQNNMNHLDSIESELIRNEEFLKRIESTVASECSEERLQAFHKIHSPIKLYSIPVHSINYDEPPKVNTSIYFQSSYQFESGDASFGNAGISSGLTEEQQEIAVAGGFVVGGIFCALTAGLACEPTTFSIASAIGTAVIGAIFTAFNNSAYASERNAYIDDVKSIYGDINSVIQNSNRKVQEKSWSSLKATCEGFFLGREDMTVAGYMTKVLLQFKESTDSFVEQKKKFVGKAEKYLAEYEQQTQDQFLFYEHLASEYEQSIMLRMEALFDLIRLRQQEAQTTFLSVVIPAINDLKTARKNIDMPIEKKVESAQKLWNQMLLRQAKYAPAEIGFDGGLVEIQNRMIILELKKEGL